MDNCPFFDLLFASNAMKHVGFTTVFGNVVAEINNFLFAEPLFFQTAIFTASEKNRLVD